MTSSVRKKLQYRKQQFNEVAVLVMLFYMYEVQILQKALAFKIIDMWLTHITTIT